MKSARKFVSTEGLKVERCDGECGADPCSIAVAIIEKRESGLQARIAELEAKIGPKPWCPDCGHPFADFHSIIGCQHLIPVYIDGHLRHHDKCRCKRNT